MSLIYKYRGLDSKLSIGMRIYFNRDGTITLEKNNKPLSFGIIVAVLNKSSFAVDRHHFETGGLTM